MKNCISFKVHGRYALFTDPVTKLGGEKFSYQVPTHESVIGIVKSIYWKPTIVWKIKRLRVINPIRTQTKGVKPLVWSGGNSLANYTYLRDVEYQVEAEFSWNLHRPELAGDRIEGKHYAIAQRMLEKGGRQDIFLGVRDCQGYVEPYEFGEGEGAYDDIDELSFGFMFHGFDYPDETGEAGLYSRFWYPVMRKGIIEFPEPEQFNETNPQLKKRFVRAMQPKAFGLGSTLKSVVEEEEQG